MTHLGQMQLARIPHCLPESSEAEPHALLQSTWWQVAHLGEVASWVGRSCRALGSLPGVQGPGAEGALGVPWECLGPEPVPLSVR